MKEIEEIDDALRDVARQRDKLLGRMPAISPARRAMLTAFVTREVPLETTFREIAVRRAQLLDPGKLTIPASIERALQWQLAHPGKKSAPRKPSFLRWQERTALWLEGLHWPAAAIACIMVTAAILCFGRWGTSLGITKNAPRVRQWNPENNGIELDRSAIVREELFAHKAGIGQFHLGSARAELPSLQASFLTSSEAYFSDSVAPQVALRLDLPAKALLTEDAISRFPRLNFLTPN